MGYFQIRLLAHIYEGVLFLGETSPILSADGPDLFHGMDALYNQAPRKKINSGPSTL